MQSIIKSFNNGCRKITNYKSNSIVIRSYTTSSNSGSASGSGSASNNGSDRIKSFEEFKRERELLKKKTHLVEKLTQLRIGGGSNAGDQIVELTKEIKRIEKELDPSLVRFAVQSRDQKMKDLELWKTFIQKKGIKTKSELKNVNKFEFERFKNTGYLDCQEEQENKLKEDEKYQEFKKDFRKTEFDDSPFVKDPFNTDVSGTSVVKEDITNTVKTFEERVNSNEKYRELALDFLDPSTPLHTKKIFSADSKSLGLSEIEEFSEKDYKQFKKDLRALLRLEQQGKTTLETELRNIKYFQNYLSMHRNSDGTINYEKALNDSFVIQNANFLDKSEDGGTAEFNHSIVTGGQFLLPVIQEGEEGPLDSGVGADLLNDERFVKMMYLKTQRAKRALKAVGADESEASEGNESAEDGSELVTDDHDDDVSIEQDSEELLDEEMKISRLGIEDEEDEEVFEQLNPKNDYKVFLPEQYPAGEEKPLSAYVELDRGEEQEFEYEIPVDYEESSISELSVAEVDPEDLTPEEIMEQQFVADGHAKDRETLIQFEKEHPEYTSSYARENYIQEIKEELNKEKMEQFDSFEDPEMVRNFLKYKFDIEKEKAKEHAERESRKYTMALQAIEKEVMETDEFNLQPNRVYNKNTGKLHIPKKKHSDCLLCRDPNWEVDPLNVPFLSLYVTSEGDLLPRAFSGNCLKHQKKIAKTFRHAKALGLFNYKNGEFGIEDPNVYTLNKTEMEDYRKWYTGNYSKQEWEEVIEELGDLDDPDDDELEEQIELEEYEERRAQRLQEGGELKEGKETEETEESLKPSSTEKDLYLADEVKSEYGVEMKEMLNYLSNNKNK